MRNPVSDGICFLVHARADLVQAGRGFADGKPIAPAVPRFAPLSTPAVPAEAAERATPSSGTRRCTNAMETTHFCFCPACNGSLCRMTPTTASSWVNLSTTCNGKQLRTLLSSWNADVLGECVERATGRAAHLRQRAMQLGHLGTLPSSPAEGVHSKRRVPAPKWLEPTWQWNVVGDGCNAGLTNPCPGRKGTIGKMPLPTLSHALIRSPSLAHPRKWACVPSRSDL